MCHVTDSLDAGGAERMIVHLAAALRDLGVEQHIVTMNEGWLSGELRREGWPVTVLQTSGSFDVRWLLTFRSFLRSRSIRLVHTHLLDAGFYGAIGSWVAGVPCVCTEHGDVAMAAKRGSRFSVKLAVAQIIARRVIAVSEETARVLRRRLRFGGSKIRVIHNGIPDEALSAPRDPQEGRQLLGLPPGGRIVGTLGALTAVKDHANLLRAHSLLASDVWCVVAGEGPLRDELTVLSERLGTASRVILPGFVRDVAATLAAFDVFCLPSASEGLPLVLIEAIAAGRPVVCTAVGGVPEVLARAGGGRLVSPNDSEALAGALTDALAGEVALSDFPAEFRVQAMAQSYLDLYEELVSP